MKKILLLFLCVSITSCGGYKTTTVSVPETSHQFEVDGQKNDLYVKANQWMVENFNNAKSVIQFSDKEAGIVSGRYYFTGFSTAAGFGASATANTTEVYALIKLQVKDGASKITVKPEDFQFMEGFGIQNSGVQSKEGVESALAVLMADYEDYMKNSTATDF